MTATLTTTSRPPAPPATRDSFARLVRAEWTKLRSVRRWAIGLLLVGVLTVLTSMLGAAGSNSFTLADSTPLGPDGRPVRDVFHFVHQPLAGDGSITARVASQAESNAWARAGLMVKASTEPGAPFASIAVTPRHGVWFQANFGNYGTGSERAAPRWLRLTRTGDAVTGYESSDGSQWREVVRANLEGLPQTVQVGMFVNSPGEWQVERTFGSTSMGTTVTTGRASFDSVTLTPPQPETAWRNVDLRPPVPPDFIGDVPSPGTVTETDGVFTVTGSGSIETEVPGDLVTERTVAGVQLGQIAVVAIAVLFITAEFKRAMIRTSFAASPRRGRVLAAKAIVIGAATFVVGLVACVASFYLAQPTLRGNGFVPPVHPTPSLTDGPVLRALIGSALYLALVAVLSLGVGAVLRRSAAAIAALIVLLIVPFIVLGGLPLTIAEWLARSTPMAGLAIQQTAGVKPFDPEPVVEPLYMIHPWLGLGVLAAWAGAALALGIWRLRRRDA